MSGPITTCWTLIDAAAEGDRGARGVFAERYAPVIETYLAARWRDRAQRGDLADALQEVFIECFKAGGALDRAEPGRPGGFRGFLYGVTRNVACRVEERVRLRREERLPSSLDQRHQQHCEEDLAAVFDRAWARSVVAQAAQAQRIWSRAQGEATERRVELLRLRFEEGLPIRDIAARWGIEPARVHKDYAQARREFERMLRQVVAEHQQGSEADIDEECRVLLACLDA